MINEEERKEIVRKLEEEYPINEEISFNEFDIAEKLAMNANLLLKYKTLYDHEKAIYDKIFEIGERIIGERYHFYRFDFDHSLTKPEIEKYYLPKDEKIQKLNVILSKQDTRVKFFELCYKAVEKAGWNMKNFLESMKRL